MITEDLILRYINGQTTLDETKKVIEWIQASEDNKKKYQDIRKLNDLLIWNSEDDSEEFNHTKYSHHLFLYKTLKISMSVAAILIVLFAAHFLITQYQYFNDPKMQMLVSPPGQRTEITLIDGTKVWLNAGSKLYFPSLFNDTRFVRLEGEGFFDVSKDLKKQFVVETSHHQIKVHGTSFNVRAYPNYPFEVSLLQGAVSVYSKQSHRTVCLVPGEKVSETDNKQLYKQSILNKDPFLWKIGIVSFHNELAKNIFRKLELLYDVKIIVKNKSLLEKRYTGKFNMKDGIEQVLKVLRYSNYFDYSYNQENDEITIM